MSIFGDAAVMGAISVVGAGIPVRRADDKDGYQNRCLTIARGIGAGLDH
ncbi:hypothetical protein [Methylobacterium sp. 37f]|nr:hypothetical protein [Methylobacterium sp. 37f]MCK2054113.1 hypothetical protein [Methylobacterium sp. 37f]